MITTHPHIAVVDAIGAHGGMHYYTDNQATALVAAGNPVTVYSLPASTDVDAVYAKMQTFTRIYGKDSKALRGFRLLRDSLTSLVSARRRGARVLIYHLFKMDRFDRTIFIVGKRLGLRTIAIVHDVERLDQPGGNGNLRSIAENCDLMVVHNTFSQDALRRVLGGIPADVAVIPSGNYIAQFPKPPSMAEARAELGLPADRTIVLFFGNPRREKGLHVLLQALLPHRDATNLLVLVAGKMKADEEVEYRDFVQAHDLGERVRFDIGHVPDAALPSYYRAADIVALPYLRIYESAVALMAMSLGRPVVASDLPPLRQVVGHDRRGMLFPAGDSAALSERLGEIARAPERLNELAGNAAEYAAFERSWTVTGSRLSEAASRLLENTNVAVNRRKSL